MQLLEEAFRILGFEDVKRLFGADTAWDVIENVLVRHFNVRLATSPRQRMAVARREMLRWVAQPDILQTQRAQFETLVLEIAKYAEDWLTSAQSMGNGPASQARGMLSWVKGAQTRIASGGKRLLLQEPAEPVASRTLTQGHGVGLPEALVRPNPERPVRSAMVVGSL